VMRGQGRVARTFAGGFIRGERDEIAQALGEDGEFRAHAVLFLGGLVCRHSPPGISALGSDMSREMMRRVKSKSQVPRVPPVAAREVNEAGDLKFCTPAPASRRRSG